MQAPPPKLKEFFNKPLVRRIASDLKSRLEEFDAAGFESAILPQLPKLELKERADCIAAALHTFLPDEYPEAINLMISSFGPKMNGESLAGMETFYYMPYSNFVAYHGLDHFEVSMNALYEITQRFTAEFSIRPFIEKHPKATMKRLHQWATDDSVHVRRLVSEGTRPRLPWASRLPEFQKDPEPVIALLEKLKADPELYVRRSVANNLNDIAKDHPDRVVELLGEWSKSKNEGTQWIIRHASRSLVKQGHPEALKLLGYSPEVKVKVTDLSIEPKTKIGETAHFSFSLTSEEKSPANLMIDFVVHYQKSNGNRNPKVFKLAQKKLAPGEMLTFRKKLSFLQRTTRVHYPGGHHLEVQVNGKRFGRVDFELVE